MAEYPERPLLTLPQSPVEPGDTFLLPVCITMAQLNDLISRYTVGMWAEYNHENPELDIEGLQPVLEAMAFIDRPEDTSCGAELPDCSDCVEHLPQVGFITYAPNDPFSTPLLIPEGYILPPWYTNPTIPLPGVIGTDAMVNFASLPVFASLPDMIESGMPRARISFSGVGELEIEFVQVPQGGYVLCTVDDNPLNNRLYDLNAVPLGDLSVIEDIFDIVIGQNLNATVTAEFEFLTPGDHHVDCTFLPQISTDTLIGFGGGLRRATLCGLSEPGAYDMPQLQTIDDGCTLQWRPNSSSAWITLSTGLCPEDGANGQDGQDGASPEMRVSGGFIQWRQDDGSPDWTNLVSLASLTGAPGTNGTDGASPEMRVSGGFIQWRQDDNSPTWTNLVSLASLTGAPGQDGQDATCEDCEPEYAPLDPENFPDDDLACVAASNAADFIKSAIDEAYTVVNAGGAFFAVGAAVVGILVLVMSAGLAWPLVLGVVAALIDLGGAGILAVFTNSVWSQFKCILFCNALPDGSWDGAAISAIVADTTSQIGGLAAPILNAIVQGMGAGGLNNAARTGSRSGVDCSVCGCEPPDPDCEVWDFTISAGGATPVGSGVAYHAGQGFWSNPGGSQDSVGVSLPARTRTVNAVSVWVTNTDATNRLFVGVNALGSALDSGADSPYIMTGLSLVLTNQSLRITHDWAVGNSATHPAIITRIEVCYNPV